MGQSASSESSSAVASELDTHFAQIKDVDAGLSKAHFIELLTLPLSEDCVFADKKTTLATRWLSLHEEVTHEEVLSLDHFKLLVHDIKVQTPAEFMFVLFANAEGQISVEDAIEIYNFARLLFLTRLHEGASVEVLNDASSAEALGKGLFSHKESMDLETFVRWTSKNTLGAFDSIYAWISSRIEDAEESEAAKQRHGVELLQEDDSEETKMTINIAWMVAAATPAVFSASHSWSLLYNSNKHGLSSSQFLHHVSKYSGPLLLKFILEDGQHYVCALDEPVKDHQKVFGSHNSRIVRIGPVFLTYDNVRAYFNLKQRHAEHGLGFGTDPKTKEASMLWIDGSFDECTTTLTHNHAGVPHTSKLHTIEVWGCANNDELKKMKERQARDLLAAQQRQMAQRPSAKEWSDSPDRQLLTMAGALTIDEQSRVSTKREDN